MEKVRIGLAGMGGIGHWHVNGILASDCAVLTAVCDPKGKESLDPERIEGEFPDVPFYTDYDEFIASGLFDAVIISSPDSTHCEYTVKALESGLDAMCEKPLTVTNEEAALIMDAVKRTGRRAFAGQICRFAPSFQKAKELIDDGKIGDMFCIESQYRHGCHKDLPKDNWRFFPPRHATACGGCHAIDIVRYFAGDPDEVFAYGNRMCRTDWSVEDCSETLMHYSNGMIARVFTTLGCIAPYSMSTTIYGTKGTIVTDNTSDKVILYTEDSEEEFAVEVSTHNTLYQVTEMCRAILYNEPARHEILEGAKTIYVCNAAIESIKTNNKVKLDYSTL